MITKTQKFIQGQWGKGVLFTLMLAILYTGYGCASYRQVSMPTSDFMANPQIQNGIADYDLYVHDGLDIYRMQSAHFVDSTAISGSLNATAFEEMKSDLKRSERKEWTKNHKYDIHIYTKENLNVSASVDGALGLVQGPVTLSDYNIKDIKVMAHKAEDGVAAALVVLVVLVGVALIAVLTVVALDANNNGGGGSDSGSGSDSDNGTGSSD